MASEELHRFLRKAYDDDSFKIQIMTESRKVFSGFNLDKIERDYVRNLAWSLDYFSNIHLTKSQIKKIRRRIDFVKNRGNDFDASEEFPEVEMAE